MHGFSWCGPVIQTFLVDQNDFVEIIGQDPASEQTGDACANNDGSTLPVIHSDPLRKREFYLLWQKRLLVLFLSYMV